MKRILALAMIVIMAAALAACGGKAEKWSREGLFTDENENFLSITVSDSEEYPGWYVGTMLDGSSYGWYIEQDGADLHGTLPGNEDEEITVTVSEEGEDGVVLKVEGGETYHFTPSDEINIE